MDVPSLIIHASVDGYLGCFYLLALVNNDAINIHVEVSVWVYVFSSLGFILRSGISRLPCNRVTVLRNCQTVCSVSTVLHSHQQLRVGSVLILTLADPCRLGLSDWNHANTCEGGLLVAPVCLSLVAGGIEHLFTCLLTIPVSSLEKSYVQVLTHLKIGLCFPQSN